MLLIDLMKLTNVNISLSELAQNIEISEDFANDPIVNITDTEINISCSNEDVNRILNFNFEKNTITELFVSKFFTGGTVYSLTGEIIKIIN